MRKAFYISLGFVCVALAAIGVLLPLLPTTPFIILASVCFAKSSDRFHQMLLNNQWFGEDLKQWQRNKTISRRSKKRAVLTIIITFGVSISLLHYRVELQLLLLSIAGILLLFICRLKEPQ